MLIAPCKDCKKRHMACHDTCVKYKKWSDTITERRRLARVDGWTTFGGKA